jgi:hypothetical protein
MPQKQAPPSTCKTLIHTACRERAVGNCFAFWAAGFVPALLVDYFIASGIGTFVGLLGVAGVSFRLHSVRLVNKPRHAASIPLAS